MLCEFFLRTIQKPQQIRMSSLGVLSPQPKYHCIYNLAIENSWQFSYSPRPIIKGVDQRKGPTASVGPFSLILLLLLRDPGNSDRAHLEPVVWNLIYIY